MPAHTATIEWTRGEDRFTDNRYHRAHVWRFDGWLTVHASSSPHLVPAPWSNPTHVDPEEAFVAALSSSVLQFRVFASDTNPADNTAHWADDVSFIVGPPWGP